MSLFDTSITGQFINNPGAAGPLEDWLRLSFVGLPAGRCRAALDRWETPTALLEAARAGREKELTATKGITATTVERLREAARRDIAPAMDAIESFDIRLLLENDEDYPPALKAIPDPPPYLWMRGTVEQSDEIAVAIVGTRHTTEYGRGIAEKLARDLAQHGVTVVSGLARGVDTAAHRGALEAGGRTFACCGCGLDIVYPSDNKNLMEQIIHRGACFSEFAPTVHPESWHFPARNRIISGLSTGVIVVEAGERSGALITADFAMEQGREVFAVPGNIHKQQSKGCHALIKQGATLVDSVEDVLATLSSRTLPFMGKTTEPRRDGTINDVVPPSGSATRAKREAIVVHPAQAKDEPVHATPPSGTAPTVRADLTAAENRVYLAVDFEPSHVDTVAESAGMNAAEVNATLLLLELKGLVRRLPGGMFERVE